jgi:hypothetical protein
VTVGGQELQHEVLDATAGQLRDLIDQRGGLTGQYPPGVSGRRRILSGLADSDGVAQRERGHRGTAASLAEPSQLGLAGAQLGRRAIDRMPRAELDVRRSAARLWPPTQIGGCGFCTGLGSKVSPLNCVYVPERRRRAVHSSCIARRCTSVIGPRSAKSTPSIALSAATHPAPMPSTTRPPLSASSDETILAVTTALR